MGGVVSQLLEVSDALEQAGAEVMLKRGFMDEGSEFILKGFFEGCIVFVHPVDRDFEGIAAVEGAGPWGGEGIFFGIEGGVSELGPFGGKEIEIAVHWMSPVSFSSCWK